MDEGRRRFNSNGRALYCLWSNDASAELWHSTPVKKKDGSAPPNVCPSSGLNSFMMDDTAKLWVHGSSIPADSYYPHSSQNTELPVKDLSSSIMQRQRRELQLLMAELKDREMELNTMTTSHHKQHQAWEQDRQRVLTLEQRCARLDEELQKRNEVIRALTKHVWVMESREKEMQMELSKTKQKLCELEKQQQHVKEACQDYEEKNQSLSSTVMALSTQVGSLQVREEELSSMLKLKDKDVTEASGRVLDLTERLRDLETTLTESRSQEHKFLKDLEEKKLHYRETRHEANQLRGELQQQVTQSSTQREEIIRLKQELQLLHADLALTGEGDNWKDELLALSRSKQERIMSELRCLQQVCENQRNDLQLLRLNKESAQEALGDQNHQGLPNSQDESTWNCLDHQSPSALQAMNLMPVHDTLTAANLQIPANNDPRVLSAHVTEGNPHLYRCSLQQLLDESRLLTASSESSSNLKRLSSLQHTGPITSCRTSEPLYVHECLKTHHHHPKTSSILKTGAVPPKACLYNCATHPASHVDNLI